jgi:thiol:disulfide interchange protein
LLAAFAGISFGSLNSSPAFNIIIGVLFLLMAAAMSGAVNFDLQKFRPQLHGKLDKSSALTPVVFGALAALLAGACVAPAVASVLVYTAQAVNSGAYYAAIVPFVLGAGMALPWPIAGAGVKILPKPGRFMNTVKYIFAAIIFLAGAYYVMSGIKLASAAPASAPADGFAALAAARQQALQEKRPVLVKFTASWCKNCAAMERGALADSRVKKVLNDEFITVTFPAEDPREPRIAALLKAWEIPGFPAFVILQPVNPQK